MQAKKRKFLVVVGSLMSGLGKGVLCASLGKILQSMGYSVVPIKFDGYLNVDCGTMNPFRHGEVFVLDDGTECDLDFGTYERFLNINLDKDNSLTGGKIFKRVIEKERAGEFLGRDVQIVPHLTDEIKSHVKMVGDKWDADVVLIEVGGTVGDLENGYFLEAMRQLASEEHVLFVQLTYVMSVAPGEQKTKPTQHATKLLLSLGIRPTIIICREDERLTMETREKIALYCNVKTDAIFDNPDLENIYELPLVLETQGMSKVLSRELGLEVRKVELGEWKKLVERIKKPEKKIVVAIAGKYTAVKDAYISISEALVHSGAKLGAKAKIKWIDTVEIEKGKRAEEALDGCDGLIVPGGFGRRGAEGKIECIRVARERRMPYLGLCFGMQLQCIEYARNVCKLKGANSTELDEKTPYPIVDLLPEQRGVTLKGATMRLGSYECILEPNSNAYMAYGKARIFERHRHRYEINNKYLEELKNRGLVVCGKSPDGNIVEMVEWRDGWGVGTQAHPELKSRFLSPSPIFVAFIDACLKANRAKKGV
ncbi:MAG: CTP synthase (glutamine hydrolyzing) [Candidatus Anstonellales archaeon]